MSVMENQVQEYAGGLICRKCPASSQFLTVRKTYWFSMIALGNLWMK